MKLSRAVSQCYGVAVAVLHESGIVPLLLRSRAPCGSADDENSRLRSIVALAKAIIGSAAARYGDTVISGADLLAECGAAEVFLPYIPLIETPLQDVCSLLNVVTATIATAKGPALSLSARCTALDCIRSRIRDTNEQDYSHVLSSQTYRNVPYHVSVTAILTVLITGTTDGTVTAPRLPYAAVSVFVPLIRSTIKQHEQDFVCRKVIIECAAVLRNLFKCYREDDKEGAQCRTDLAEFVASPSFHHLLELTDNDALMELLRFIDVCDDASLALGLTPSRLGHIIREVGRYMWNYHRDVLNLYELLAKLAARLPAFA
mgnify:CR=1 FL=1